MITLSPARPTARYLTSAKGWRSPSGDFNCAFTSLMTARRSALAYSRARARSALVAGRRSIVFANEFGRLVGTIVTGQLHRPGLEVEPEAGFDEFLPRPVVMRIEG